MAILSILSSQFVSAAPVAVAKKPGFFSRCLTAVMNARAKEAERIIATTMRRRGMRLVAGEWVARDD